jgi:CHAD domain-containing protein
MPFEKNNLDNLFDRLAKSKFRSRFKLSRKDRDYLEQKGFSTIKQHAHDFLNERLAPAIPKNDGKQTPMKNHPVFIAQHATATCCRKCLKKWHDIETGKELNQEQINYLVSVIICWLEQAVNNEVVK